MKENSIEEDIKIIEKYLSHFKKVCSPEMLKKDEIIKVIQYKEIQALQHILTDYKRVLKENRESKSNIVPVLINNKMYFIDNELYKELLKEIKKENELRDKTIELMAKYIESKNLLVDKYYYVLTADSIKEYFKNKAKKE